MIIRYYINTFTKINYHIGAFNFYNLWIEDIGQQACNECEWIVPGTIDCNNS